MAGDEVLRVLGVAGRFYGLVCVLQNKRGDEVWYQDNSYSHTVMKIL